MVPAGTVTVCWNTPLWVAMPIGIRADRPRVAPNRVADVAASDPLALTQAIENDTDWPGAATDGNTSICGPAAKAGSAAPARVARPASVRAAPAERMERMRILSPVHARALLPRA